VSKVQNMRKTADLDVTQRIRLVCCADAEFRAAVEQHLDYVLAETLARECRWEPAKPAEASDWDLNGHPCAIRLENA
jgi:hypothetical protein